MDRALTVVLPTWSSHMSLKSRFISYLEGILLDNSSPDATADPRERQIQSKMAQIPQEIILVIANRLNKAALASLIQTCRYFHFMLEPTLYREINTTIPWRDKKADLLLRTLANRSDLFATIRAYHGPLALIPQPTPKPNLIKRILRVENSISNWFLSSPVPTVSFFTQAINIVNLELTDDCSWMLDPLFEPALMVLSSLSLRQLVLWRPCPSIRLLRDQPDLDELTLGGGSVGLAALQSTDIPNLRSLHTTLRQAGILVPGRPIETLRLLPPSDVEDFDQRYFLELTLSTARIVNFSTYMFCYPYMNDEGVRIQLQVISQSLPHLERLTLTVNASISSQILLDQIPSLRSLRSLALIRAELASSEDLTQTSADGLSEAQSVDHNQVLKESWSSLFGNLKERCPGLVELSYTPLASFEPSF